MRPTPVTNCPHAITQLIRKGPDDYLRGRSRGSARLKGSPPRVERLLRGTRPTIVEERIRIGRHR